MRVRCSQCAPVLRGTSVTSSIQSIRLKLLRPLCPVHDTLVREEVMEDSSRLTRVHLTTAGLISLALLVRSPAVPSRPQVAVVAILPVARWLTRPPSHRLLPIVRECTRHCADAFGHRAVKRHAPIGLLYARQSRGAALASVQRAVGGGGKSCLVALLWLI